MMFDVFSDPTLHEEDPMTTDWEGCKAAINEGKIATMVMGSWAVSQFKEAGDHPDDIGYMPAPFSKDGKQYAESAPDYCMGVNKNRSDDIKALGKKYITWFVGESGFAQKEGSICALKGSALPDYLTDFADCELFITEAAPEGLVGVWDAINNDSEVGTWQGDADNFKIKMAEAAFAGQGEDAFKQIVSDTNAVFLVAALLPNISMQVTVFQIVSKLGLYNSLAAPCVLYIGTDIISIYIFIQFLNNISTSLDESAILDGASYPRVYFSIILPMLRPAIATVLVIKFVSIYNDFYTANLYMPGDNLSVVSTALYRFIGPYGAKWEVIFAGIIICIIPTLVVFLCLQKSIYSNLVTGSVKE